MTNFDFLKSDPQFSVFTDAAISSECLLHIDTAASVLNCRRAMELAVNWMYSVDNDLDKPNNTTLISLMNTNDFKEIVDCNLYKRMDFIRKTGNVAAHGTKKISIEQASLCIENLFYFLDFISYCYSKKYTPNNFNPDLLELTTEEALAFVTEETVDLEKLIAENNALKDELTSRRAEHRRSYISKPIDLSSSFYIDKMLEDKDEEENDI